MAYTTSESIRVASDVNGKPVYGALDTTGNTAAYKYYSDTLEAGTTTVTYDVETDLGRAGTTGYLVNLSSGTTLTAAFAVGDGGFGDEIVVRYGYILNLQTFIKFSQVRLTQDTGDATFDLVVV